MQAIVIALGCAPQLGGKTLKPETTYFVGKTQRDQPLADQEPIPFVQTL